MLNFSDWFGREKIAVIFSVLVLFVVGIAYFGVSGIGLSRAAMGSDNPDLSLYEGVELKLGFSPEGEAKVFARASNNALSRFTAVEGNSIPEQGSMVLGEMEARVMKEEGLFSTVGDRLPDFFGLSLSIEGVLEKTMGPADYFHFLSAGDFEKISGDSGALFLVLSDADATVFYRGIPGSILPGSAVMAEGTLGDFEEHRIVGNTYYPVILGFEEAKRMREEHVFAELGDTFETSGIRFIVVGVLEKNGSLFDWVHVVSLEKESVGAWNT